MEKWPQHKEGDLEAFISNLEENERVFRLKIENRRSIDMGIAIEPQGSGDTFPVGSVYEVVVVSQHENSDIQVQIRDNSIFVYCNSGYGAIFHNGAATLAY